MSSNEEVSEAALLASPIEEAEEDTSVVKEEEEEEEPMIETTVDDEHDPEIEAIKSRVREMEEEAEKLKEMQKAAEELSPTTPVAAAHASLLTSPTNPALAMADKGETDARSVYVGNVDYAATATDLEQHFHGCGSVNRVTILCDRYSGQPKGFAYVEFTDKDSVEVASQLNDSLFKGRQIKVTPKRTNIPGMSTTNRFPRARGRGRGRGGYGGYGGGYGGYSPRPRGRGGFRGRRPYYSPY